MEKGNKVYLAIIILCAVVVVVLCGFAIYNHEDIEISDAARFKKEYEAYNGLVNESNEKNYLNVDIASENPIVYKTGKEILDILKNDSAVVYFGFASCPWCRNMIGPLLKAAEEESLKTIYYVDIFDIRDTYIFTGNIIPEQTKKGTNAYYEILEFLGDNLEEYYIKDESGNMYDTGVKRLYAPSVVAVKDGKVIKFHEGTLDSQEDPYEELSFEDKEMLKGVYLDLIKSLNTDDTNTCSSSGAC